MEIPLERIYPNPDQPRKNFETAKLVELALPIKEQGLIEPIVVVDRPQGDKDFMIVAGERRWRACQLAGLTKAPVRFIKASEEVAKARPAWGQRMRISSPISLLPQPTTPFFFLPTGVKFIGAKSMISRR